MTVAYLCFRNIVTFLLIYEKIRLGDQAFAAAGPRLWNGLPTYDRQPDLIHTAN